MTMEGLEGLRPSRRALGIEGLRPPRQAHVGLEGLRLPRQLLVGFVLAPLLDRFWSVFGRFGEHILKKEAHIKKNRLEKHIEKWLETNHANRAGRLLVVP